MVTFRSYVSEDGVDQINLWLAAQDEAVKVDLVAVVAVLENINSRERWPESAFKELERSPCKGLSEIILDVEGVKYRVFGFAGPREDDFTMLYAFRKSDDPTYRTSCPEAQKLRAEVMNDWTRAGEWKAP
jgi:hypothetical protein